MAFELLFFKPKNKQIELNDVLDFFKDKPHFTTKSLDSDHHQFLYKNDITQVAFNIVYNIKDELITELVFDENYEFCYTSFSMSFIRPRYFAHEAMPIVYEFSKQFDLYINDLQNLEQPKNALKQYTEEELIISYTKNNEIASKEFNAQFPLIQTTKEKSMAFYQYLTKINDLEQEYSEVVPLMSFMKNVNTNELFTVITWDNGEETLLPRCDYVLAIKEVKGFLGRKKQETSLLPYEDIIHTFRDHLKKLNDNLYSLEETSVKTNELFQSLPIKPYDDYEVIKNDEYIDIKL